MGTVRYTSYLYHLLVTREGEARLLKRQPWRRRPGEYLFRLFVRIPKVDRPAIEGELIVELPPDVDPDASPSADVTGPVE